MIRFKKLVIHNIQKHGHLEINLDSNITAIVGSSDSGKSAIIRALSFVIFNRPTSSELRTTLIDSDGNQQLTKESYVVLYFNKDGVDHEVERYVSNTKNTYRLDSEVYKSFGRSVPTPITNQLDLDPTLNFQGQYDTPFLLSYPSGEVSRIFNELLGLSVASDLSNIINSDIRKVRSEIEHDSKELEQLDTEINSKALISDVERYQSEIDIVCSELSNMHQRGLKIELCLNEINNIENNSIYKYKTDLNYIEKNLEDLSISINEMSFVKNRLKCMGDVVDGYRSVRCVAVPVLDDLSIHVSNLQSIQDKIIKVDGIIKKVQETEYKLSEINLELRAVDDELKTFKICETCHRPLEE